MKRLEIYGVVLAVLLLIIPAAVAAVPTTVTVFLHNDGVGLEPGITSSYYIDVFDGTSTTILGRFHNEDTFILNAPRAVTYVAYTGSIRGPRSGLVTIGDGVNQLAVEYASVEVYLHHGSTVLDGSAGQYLLIADPIGQKFNGEVFEVPAGTQVPYQACTNSMCGSLLAGSFGSGPQWLAYEYTEVTVQLHNNGDPLNRPTYYLYVYDVDERGTGEVFYAPEGAVASFDAVTTTAIGSVWGPTETATIGPPDQTLTYEYATVQVHLYNGPDDLSWPYTLEVEDIGTFENGQEFHVPPRTFVDYRAKVNTLIGPSQTASFVAGDQPLDVEYATVKVKLINGMTQLYDRTTYFLEIEGLFVYTGYNDKFEVPADTDFRYRAWTSTPGIGTISGPWQTTRFGAGARELVYEYATVKFVFDLAGVNCPLQTRVTGIGNIANGGKVHVPWDTTVNVQADVCGGLSGIQQKTFSKGEGTVTWSMKGDYTQP
ncbi:MAG: hypothetical protein LUQ62_00830 [Methanomicrobiales archaeon]|nr:hypothetical protein [Methanomicrobiales archaeon]